MYRKPLDVYRYLRCGHGATSPTARLTRHGDDFLHEGVEELDPDRLPDLLELKYGGLPDAMAEIGANVEVVRGAFCDFQKYLYEESVGAA